MLERIQDAEFCDLKNISHGFFSRNGGVSKKHYASLNFSRNSQDDPNNIKENIAIIEDHYKAKLAIMNQVHGNNVEVVTDNSKILDADALVTKKTNLILGVTTADCAPVLIADDVNKVIAAIHAGWRSAYSDIIDKTIKRMLSLGAERRHMKAVIGPAIQKESYEVDQNFMDEFIKNNYENKKFFIIDKNIKFDLPGFIIHKLSKQGIFNSSNMLIDTYSDQDRFFSRRRSFHQNIEQFGTQLSTILIRQD